MNIKSKWICLLTVVGLLTPGCIVNRFPEGEDLDGDGYLNPGEDCNDDDPLINPDAVEVCDDEIDNDCDLLIDAEDDDCMAAELTTLDAWLDI